MNTYLNCLNCGCEFSAIRVSKRYCSHNCKIYAYRLRVKEKQKKAIELKIFKEMERQQQEHFRRMTADWEKFKEDFTAKQNQNQNNI